MADIIEKIPEEDALNILSDRSLSLAFSQTLVMAQKFRELKKAGYDMVNLSIGEPDFKTPDYVKDAAKKAIDDDFTYYSPVRGYDDLLKAISEKFKKENNLDYKMDEIIVSNGAKHSIANVLLSIINYSDEVLVPAPYWPSYFEIVKIAEGRPVLIKTTMENNFKVTPDQIEKAITPQTKAIFINSPSNPTGSVYTRAELKAIADVLEKHKRIFIISDEIYEHIIFDEEHVSIAQFENIKDRVITVNGHSKGYAMTGWRIGYIGAHKTIVDACAKIQGQYTSCPCTISQKAAVAALTGNSTFTKDMGLAFKKRRKLIMDLLAEIPGLKVFEPKGAFYVFPDVSHYLGKSFEKTPMYTSRDLTNYFLEKAHVSCVAGAAFGAPEFLRLSFATSDADIIKGMGRIKKALSELK